MGAAVARASIAVIALVKAKVPTISTELKTVFEGFPRRCVSPMHTEPALMHRASKLVTSLVGNIYGAFLSPSDFKLKVMSTSTIGTSFEGYRSIISNLRWNREPEDPRILFVEIGLKLNAILQEEL